MALTPIALIPQIILGGMMVPMTTVPWLQWPMMIMPARWGFQGAVAQERIAIATNSAWMIDLQKPDLNSVDNFITNGKFQCAIAQVAGADINGAWDSSIMRILASGWCPARDDVRSDHRYSRALEAPRFSVIDGNPFPVAGGILTK